MSDVRSGGGFSAILYTLRKSFQAYGGPLRFWRRMSSRNACKTCAFGMGGVAGGMRNELGQFPEFCKKSVQAMAADMQSPLHQRFFESTSVDELSRMTSRELENLGRLAYPVQLKSGESHYRRVSWDDALNRAAGRLRSTDPRRVFLYSSGRSSNEAAFLLQWLGRVYGTNNIHNCSYYCHQASGVGLARSIGSTTATVTLEDVEHSDFVLLLGANPASNHPRLIATLARIRARGGVVVVVNPLRETGLDQFRVPSHPGSLLFGSTINDLYIQPRIGGDIALLKGVLKLLVERGAVDRAFIETHTSGWSDVVQGLEGETLEDLADEAAVPVNQIVAVADFYGASSKAVFMWAMGITHHAHGVDNVHAITNLALARGMVGRRHAGLMPIRGHSNVQGIGSMGFSPELKRDMLKVMEDVYGIAAPTWIGLNSADSVEASSRGEIDVALLLGGNFFASNPDLTHAARALGRIGMTIHISTKLNHGHVIPRPDRPDGEVLILPTLVRDEESQATTQESMFSFVRLSSGGAADAGKDMRSEVDIITSLGARLLPDGPIDFEKMRDHDQIREAMAMAVPGYTQVADIASKREEFHVEGRVRHVPVFDLPGGRARFVVVQTPRDPLESGMLRLMTIRSEGQFNTVVYEEHDRYRNQATRNVILMNVEDMQQSGLSGGDKVRVQSDVGMLSGIRVAPFNIARGCAAMYYPEANVLVPRSVDPASGTPRFKNVHVTLSRDP